MEMDHTSQLAQHLVDLKFDQLPVEVVLQAKKSILNAIGCGLGYAYHRPATKAFEYAQATKSNNTSTILGRKQKTSLESSILINGIAITTADFDDTHLRTVIHPSGTPLAALLSFAELNRMTGRDFILAFVCGVEAQCAVGNAISPGHYRDGWHVTGTTGTFGAAAAIAKAQRLGSAQFTAALGHASSMAAGTRAMFGTDTKTIHMGRGAQNGLLASQLAKHGFESCSGSIEAWAKLVSTTISEDDISAIARSGSYQILENTFKPYPCGIVIHPLIDAGIHAHDWLRQQLPSGSFVRAIESISATVNPQCVRLCAVRHPFSGLQTIFSLYHGLASGLLYGEAGPAQFSDDGCNDLTTKALRDKIDVAIDERKADHAATILVRLIDSREHEFDVEHATGSLARPMTVDQLEYKFMSLAATALGRERAADVLKSCWQLEAIDDMASFVQRLAG